MTLGAWVEHWHAYDGGPVVDEHPWSLNWEQDPKVHDGHAHEWERIIWADTTSQREDGGFDHAEIVVRCRACGAPRCGHSGDRPPCREVRHHLGPHHLGGQFEPVGAA